MDRWIAPELLFDGTVVQRGKALQLSGGRVVKVADAPADAVAVTGLVTPGFVDLQVNGGGGIMLNTTPTHDGIAGILAAHRGLGTVAVMPTVITDHPDVLDKAADAAIAAKGLHGFVGLHIEGPHISVARRGTHAAQYVRPFDDRTMETVMRLRAQGIAVMITLAPENATATQVATLVQNGVVVSIGHTDATAEELRILMAAGATCATHLFNAMSPMLGRAPGAVGAVINSDCYAGIICDGHHVADEIVGMAIRARPTAGRMMLVSDAMATVGGPDEFTLYGQTIRLQDGRLVNEEGSLAGAHVTQALGVQRLVVRTGTPLETALAMATTVPADCMGRPDLGGLMGRGADDLVVLDADTLDYRGDLATALATTAQSNAAQ
ncbi:N-acetylglucosamine-6-phosphate deacetylase [Octadecabacter sp. R77987]|uniref:N-acetylglucosamine-6-phosphate deacetylase n=1 Tax=Octadecabacter sp. R77987 TaxID=3093874 RepID=UPI0036724B5F